MALSATISVRSAVAQPITGFPADMASSDSSTAVRGQVAITTSACCTVREARSGANRMRKSSNASDRENRSKAVVSDAPPATMR